MEPTSPARSRLRLRLRTFLFLIAIAAILLGWYVACDRAFERAMVESMFGKPDGPVRSRKDWPLELRQLLDDPAGDPVNQAAIQVDCLCKGLDLEYVWRMEVTPGLLEVLKQRWNLTQTSEPDWPILKGRSLILGVPMPPWWSPRVDEGSSFFTSPFEPGEGPGIQVALDRERNVIFVHSWNSF